MQKHRKIVLFCLVLIALYLIYIVYKYKTKGDITNIITGEPIIIASPPKTDTSGNVSSGVLTNFELIQLNTKTKPDANNICTFWFNDHKHKAQIYSNGRYYIWNALNQFVGKGSYREGGKILYPDYGTKVEGTNVEMNFKQLLPKPSLTSVTTYS